MTAVVIRDMSPAEARESVSRINARLSELRAEILDLHERKGWRALGYDSWLKFVLAELAIGVSQVYRELTAGKVEANISPTGEIGVIPERLLRELAPLANPEAQRFAWQVAQATAPSGELTSRWVKATVNVLQEARATGGQVTLGTGEQSAFGAAITAEAAELAARQRQHITEKNPPLLNDLFTSIEAAAEAIRTLPHTGGVRVLVYGK